ncbi:MAG: YaaL family protein [Lachnospiraceae bacterium]|nr:YaaL family protein [Lachnospiraceae bacterium]
MKWHFSQSSYGKNRTLSSVENTSILDDLERTRLDLEMAYSGFDNVTDPDLIDCYIFEVNAVLKRYKYLLAQAAKMNSLPDDVLCSKTPVNVLTCQAFIE